MNKFDKPEDAVSFVNYWADQGFTSFKGYMFIDKPTLKAARSITFNYKDYADNHAKKQMTLICSEFTRRFEQRILPSRFTKIRIYGYLANRNRLHRINEVLKTMKLPFHPGIVKKN